jgi:hypothetical protein
VQGRPRKCERGPGVVSPVRLPSRKTDEDKRGLSMFEIVFHPRLNAWQHAVVPDLSHRKPQLAFSAPLELPLEKAPSCAR